MINLGVISDAAFFFKKLFYEPHPEGFSSYYFFFFGGGARLNLCSLDLIAFSLLLPRLSTSAPLSAKKHKSLA